MGRHRRASVLWVVAVIVAVSACDVAAPGAPSGSAALADTPAPESASPAAPVLSPTPAPTSKNITPGATSSPSSVPAIPDASPPPLPPLPAPITDETGRGVAAVAQGKHGCVLFTDATVGCWGDNAFGQATAPAGRFRAVTVGGLHSCAIREDGTAQCWGNDESGQATPPAGTFVALAAGALATCGLRPDGSLSCWGSAEYGLTSPPAGTFITVALGTSRGCAISSAHRLACWGTHEGSIGDAPGGVFVALSMAGTNACAIKSDGWVTCWGADSVPRPAPGEFIAVSASPDGGCALHPTTLMSCWSATSEDDEWDGDWEDDFGDSPWDDNGSSRPPTGAFAALATGPAPSCAIRPDATLECWPQSSGPHPGVTVAGLAAWRTQRTATLRWSTTPAFSPVVATEIQARTAGPTGHLGEYRHVATVDGDHAALALEPGDTACYRIRVIDEDGLVSRWSDRICATRALSERALWPSGGWTTVRSAAYAGDTALRTTAAGATLRLNGIGAYWLSLLATRCPECGEVDVLMNGIRFAHVNLASPVRETRAIIPAFDFSIAQDDPGDPYVAEGTLLLRVTTSGKPVTIDGVLLSPVYDVPSWVVTTEPELASVSSSRRVRAIDTGDSLTCAIGRDRRLVCWGGLRTAASVPPKGTFRRVAASGPEGCAIRTDGRLACWDLERYTGTARVPDGRFREVFVGSGNACAIRTDGAVACWGSGYNGDSDEPAELKAPDGTFTSISMTGDDHCGLRTDGTISCWGSDGPRGTMPEGTFKALSASFEHACAIRTDGSVTCWRSDGRTEPAPPAGTYTAVAVGANHACALTTHGRIRCWGDDHYLQLHAPSGRFKAITAALLHTCAVRVDDTFVCWGDDRSGTVTPAPAVSLASGPRVVPSSRAGIALRWSGRSLAPIRGFDLRYRAAAWNGAFGPVVIPLAGTTARSTTLRARPGTTYCVRVRASDVDGRTSPWSAHRCVAVPLSERAMLRSSGWSAVTGSRYADGAALRATRRGAALTIRGVRDGVVSIIATTCPTCGSVNVWLGDGILGTVSLRSATRVDRAVIRVGSTADWGDGGSSVTISIHVASSGKPVIIDGIAIRRVAPFVLSPQLGW